MKLFNRVNEKKHPFLIEFNPDYGTTEYVDAKSFVTKSQIP